jgi:hypothetical protein
VQQPAGASGNGNGTSSSSSASSTRAAAATSPAAAAGGVSIELDERQEAARAAAEVDPCLGYGLEATDWGRGSLSVVVLGASGDLAKKKIFPALFALAYEGLLPQVGVLGVCVWVRVDGASTSSSCGLVGGTQQLPLPHRRATLLLWPPLPQDFQIFGYARSKMTDEEFRALIASTLTCRVAARWVCADMSHACAGRSSLAGAAGCRE